MANSHFQYTGNQAGARRSMLAGEVLDTRDTEDVEIGSFEVADTPTPDELERSLFVSYVRMVQGYPSLGEFLSESHEALTFVNGGSGFITLSPGRRRPEYRSAVGQVVDAVGISLRVGTGQGRTAEQAGYSPTEALDACRQQETRLEATGSGPSGAAEE